MLGTQPAMSAFDQVHRVSFDHESNLVKCMVRHPTAREKFVDEGKSASMYPSIRAKMLSRTNVSLPLLEATLGVGA
jgi:hypothetical protein